MMRMLIFVLCIYSTSALAMEKEERIDRNTHQSVSISKEDVENLVSAFKGKRPLQIMTVGINPKIFEDSLQHMIDIHNLYKGDFSQITLSELSEELQADFGSSQEDQLTKYKENIKKINSANSETLDLKEVIRIGNLAEHNHKVFKTFFQEKLKNSILKQEEDCHK